MRSLVIFVPRLLLVLLRLLEPFFFRPTPLSSMLICVIPFMQCTSTRTHFSDLGEGRIPCQMAFSTNGCNNNGGILMASRSEEGQVLIVNWSSSLNRFSSNLR